MHVRAVVTLRPVGSGWTELTMTEQMPSTSMFDFAEIGLHQCIDKLVAIFAQR